MIKHINDTVRLSEYLATKGVANDVTFNIIEGLKFNSMSLQVTSHLLNLIEWDNVISDPLRKQFLPFASEYLEDHPNLIVDSLEENRFQIFDGIIHKYPRTILFILGTVCPAYCAFCTRSYVVGKSTPTLEKQKIKVTFQNKVTKLIEYLKSNDNIIDIVVSGGDVLSTNLNTLESLIVQLSTVKHLKSIRLATRGLTFTPQSLQKGTLFYNVLLKIKQILNKQNVILSLQSHFNHINEINNATEQAINDILDLGIIIRNQTVLLKNINSDTETMFLLIDKLIKMGVQPYYVYQMDMVKHTEHFRTTIQSSIRIYNELIGKFPGFAFPRFIVDLPNGGGKKDIWAYEWKDEILGVFAYKSTINPNQVCYYHNPTGKTNVSV